MVNFYDLTWENSGPLSCFITNSETFANNRTRGVNYLNRYSFLQKDLIKTSQIIYRDNPELKKFKNKKILVLGAGPTTNWYDWNPNEYDHIFSCNHFFLNEKLSKCKVDLILLCDEVDLKGEKFLDYVTKNNTLVGFEDYNKSADNVKVLNDTIPNNVFDCVLRFQGKIGVAPKLIILAVLLGASQVDFAGIDGPPSKDYKVGDLNNHSFEKDKPCKAGYPYELLYYHYLTLKTYLQKEIGEDVIFNNLGAGHDCNVLSKIGSF